MCIIACMANMAEQGPMLKKRILIGEIAIFASIYQRIIDFARVVSLLSFIYQDRTHVHLKRLLIWHLFSLARQPYLSLIQNPINRRDWLIRLIYLR